MNRQMRQRKRKSRRMSQRCALPRFQPQHSALPAFTAAARLWSQEEREPGTPLTSVEGDSIEIGAWVNVVEGGVVRAAAVEDTDEVENCIYVRWETACPN